MVDLLIACNSNLELHRDGFTPLHAAVARGSVEITKRLLKQGVQVNQQDQNGKGYSPLHWATQEGYIECVKLLVQFGANVNLKDQYGFSSLYIASSEGYTDIVSFLLRNNAKVDTICEQSGNSTPLMIASIYDHPDVVTLLIHHNADIEAKDDEGRTALFQAALNKNKEVISILLKKGANKNIIDVNGRRLVDILSED
jgi:ankyrin repeat protein